MAIILDGKYVVVEAVHKDNVILRTHQDASHRERYKEGRETPFEHTIQTVISVPVDMTAMADPTKSIAHNNITSGYEALLASPGYEEAQSI